MCATSETSSSPLVPGLHFGSGELIPVIYKLELPGIERDRAVQVQQLFSEVWRRPDLHKAHV